MPMQHTAYPLTIPSKIANKTFYHPLSQTAYEIPNPIHQRQRQNVLFFPQKSSVGLLLQNHSHENQYPDIPSLNPLLNSPLSHLYIPYNLYIHHQPR